MTPTAPSLPAVRRERGRQVFQSGLTLEEKIKEILIRKRFEPYLESMRRAKTYLLMDLFYRGYQNIGPWDAGMAAWPSYDADPLEYQENRFRRNVLVNCGTMIKMEPAPILRPASGNVNDIEAASTAQDAWEKGKDEIGYDNLIAQKSLQKILFGHTFIYSGYEQHRRFGILMVPTYKTEVGEIPGSSICPQCGMTSEMETLDCPQCGAPMQQYPPIPMENSVVSGYTEQARGQLFSTAFSPLEILVRSSTKGGLKNAPYLLRIWREDIERIEYAFQNLDLDRMSRATSSSSDPSSDIMLRYQQILGTLPGNPYGATAGPYWTTAQQFGTVDMIAGWLEPETFRGDPELLKEAPDGLMAVMAGSELADWRPEKKSDVWTDEVYYPNTHNFYGDGMFDDLPIQRAINQVGQLKIRHLEYDTIPLRLYDDAMLTTKPVSNDPAQKWLSVQTGLDKGLDKAVRDLPAQQLSWDVIALGDELRKTDQDISGATDPMAGQIAGANTPYSAQVLAVEQGQTRMMPSSRYNKEAVKDHVRQVLQLAQKNWTDPRTLAEIDKNTGRLSWKQFQGADLSRGNWTVYIMDTDFKPRTRGEQMQALEQARNFGVDILATPKLRLQFFERIGITPDGDMVSTQARRASRIIERIRNGEMVTPEPMVDDGVIQGPVLREFLASPQGDDLKMDDPQAWGGIMMYMQTVIQMAAMEQMAMAQIGMGAVPTEQGKPAAAGGGTQGGAGAPQKVERAQSPVPEGQQQPMPQSPARQAQGAGTM